MQQYEIIEFMFNHVALWYAAEAALKATMHPEASARLSEHGYWLGNYEIENNEIN